MSIKFSQSVTPITDMKSKSRAIVNKLKQTGKPILITQRGRAACVMESVESFEKREEHYEEIEGILKALGQAERGELKNHEEALNILGSF